VPDFPFRRLRSVFDLGKLRLDPDTLVSNTLGVGLGLSDQRLETPTEFRRRGFVETVIDLAGVDEIRSLAAADIEAVPLRAVEGETCNGLPLRAGASLPS
jgi:hypothetical protein